ncbi:MAG: tetratricopeptide repeat protein [Acidobacteria bacterium]|nr:tetratricopeptide repeat protein [Acidobacteriota bacterium]MCB9396918.1 tetratricopeptide repeat protein [Acidobacteriota bacterium]
MNQHLIELLENQWKKDPNSRVFLRLAEEYRKSGRYGEAIGVCQAGLVNHPHYLPGLVCLGRSQLACDQLNDAEATLRQANQLDPDNIPVLHSLVELFQKMERPTQAIPFLERLLLWDPSEQIQDQLAALRAQLAPVVQKKQQEEPQAEPFPETPAVEPAVYEDYHQERFTRNEPFSSAPAVPTVTSSEPDPLAEFESLMHQAHEGSLHPAHDVQPATPSEPQVVAEEHTSSDDFDNLLVAQLYKQQGHLEDARAILNRIRQGEEDPDLHSQLEKMDAMLQNESKSAKKIRILSHWLRRIKEMHHVS